MSTEVIDPPKTVSTIKEPETTSMARAVADKFFAESEPKKEEPKTEPKVEPKQEPKIEVKTEVKTKGEPEPKPKSRTALEFDNQRDEYEAKVKAVETQRDEIKAQIVDMQNELVTLREKASSSADYAEIKKKNDELKEIVSRLDIQQLPEFKQKYTAQEEYIFQQVKSVLDGTENSDAILKALKMAPSAEREAKLDELKQDLGISKVSKLAAWEARLDELTRNREFEVSNADVAKRLYQEEQEKMAAQEKKSREQIFSKYSQHFSENDPTYKKIEGNDAFNQNVDARIAEAKRLYDSATTEERAQAMLAAVDRPVLLSLLKKMNDEYTELKKAYDGKIQATPGVAATRKDEGDKPKTFVESIAQSFQ